MTIAIGDKLPPAKFKEKTADGPVEITTEQLFDGKKVVLFAVPGAFTPTCTLNHLPGYLENRDAILSKGVDDIAVLAVNDWHVMGAWATQTGGLGVRSKRYSMLVENGVVKSLNVEESPGQATVSGAAAMLEQL